MNSLGLKSNEKLTHKNWQFINWWQTFGQRFLEDVRQPFADRVETLPIFAKFTLFKIISHNNLLMTCDENRQFKPQRNN